MKLNKEQAASLATLQSALENGSTVFSSLVQELRDVWDEKSVKWQESEAGAAANDWIEEFERMSENLISLEEEIAGLENEDQS